MKICELARTEISELEKRLHWVCHIYRTSALAQHDNRQVSCSAL